MKDVSPIWSVRLIEREVIIFALCGWVLATLSMAQDQSGRSLIFDTQRNRHPSEPMGYQVTGGPTSDQTKELLQQRIKEQSEGQITLFGFRQITTKALDLEINGKLTCALEFEAGIEFQAPCKWASRYRSRPLTFVVLKPESDLPGADVRNVFEVKGKGERFVMQGYALFTPATNGWVLTGFGQSSRPVRESVVPDEASAECINHLKQIGLAFRMWALDNNDKYPFNASTKAGGTMELCVRGSDGFDTNAGIHFQVMSNELNTPKLLVCPADASRQPAQDFRKVQAANVTYLMRSGTNIDETNPEEILVRCPIHGHVCLCDGSVKRGTGK